MEGLLHMNLTPQVYPGHSVVAMTGWLFCGCHILVPDVINPNYALIRYYSNVDWQHQGGEEWAAGVASWA
jgi:hypothetical protein